MKDRSLLAANPQISAKLAFREELEGFPQTSFILIVGEDTKVAHFLAGNLELSGLNTRVLTHWEKVPLLLSSASLIILLLNLNDSVTQMKQRCQEIRRHTESPIMVLSDEFKDCSEHSLLSLQNCEVLVDPLFCKNVLDEVHKTVRGAEVTAGLTFVLEHGDLLLEHQKRKVTVDGREVAFTPSEYKLLHTLMGSPGRVFLRDELLDVLYERNGMVVDRVIDVHIGKIRRKIEKDPAHPQHILTVRGIGYKFSDMIFCD